jgi:hypothetical protein
MKQLALTLAALMMTVTVSFAQDNNSRFGIGFDGMITTQNLTVNGKTSSDSTTVFGPTVYYYARNHYATATLLKGSNSYEFDLGGGAKASGKHSTLDLEAGYLLNDLLALHVGWRSMNLDLDYYTGATKTGTGMLHTYGPVIGLRAAGTMADTALTLGGDLSIMSMTTDTKTPSGNTADKRTGYSYEASATYPIQETLTLKGGYKYQNFVSSDNGDSITKGLFFNAGYSF